MPALQKLARPADGKGVGKAVAQLFSFVADFVVLCQEQIAEKGDT